MKRHNHHRGQVGSCNGNDAWMTAGNRRTVPHRCPGSERRHQSHPQNGRVE